MIGRAQDRSAGIANESQEEVISKRTPFSTGRGIRQRSFTSLPLRSSPLDHPQEMHDMFVVHVPHDLG